MPSIVRTFTARIDSHPALAARAELESGIERKLCAALRSGRKFSGLATCKDRAEACVVVVEQPVRRIVSGPCRTWGDASFDAIGGAREVARVRAPPRRGKARAAPPDEGEIPSRERDRGLIRRHPDRLTAGWTGGFHTEIRKAERSGHPRHHDPVFYDPGPERKWFEELHFVLRARKTRVYLRFSEIEGRQRP
ncbi:protein of unknown function [Bradyrhizobium vignae]|uniref:Uncharacterized protein n=1 Tax=Bradyrhizobium vignae TaxID=1549949 RepID=A0A2U3PV06_9BRAD|nr:protein of unknown function [Bradyrhizobium vignae]